MKKMVNYIKKQKGIIYYLTKYIYLLIFEYFTNHIVSHFPNAKLRYLFYRYVIQCKISSKAYIHMGIYIYPSYNNLIIGEYSIINSNCILDRRGSIHIGNNVNISREVAIYTGGHKINSPTFEYYDKPVKIDDYVWIGTRSMIMPGVLIGKGAMVMPGAIVTKDVAPFSIVAGIPAKKIGNRSEELSYELTWRSMFL